MSGAIVPASPRGGAKKQYAGRLHSIEITNFKSYGGSTKVIGPFKDFTAVVGPNGAGKSNLMDSVAFAVGLKSSNLRGKQLQDLIYKAQSDKGDEKRTASVALIYESSEGKKTAFKRVIHSNGVGEYRVDGKKVGFDVYSEKMQSFGIQTKAHTGFLVFQGYVSELAVKSPMELTLLFEQISGSDEFKEEYDRLELEKKKAEDDQIYSYQKKKGLTQEKTSMRKQKEEAEKYAELQEERKGMQTQVRTPPKLLAAHTHTHDPPHPSLHLHSHTPLVFRSPARSSP